MTKKKPIRKAKNFDELLNIEYGKVGTKKRDEFEKKAKHFADYLSYKQATSKSKARQSDVDKLVVQVKKGRRKKYREQLIK